MKPFDSVLIVDDDPTQIAILSSYFAGFGGCVVQGVNNPIMALQRIEEATTPFSLVVSDLQMPGMDGIEFMRHLGEREFSGKLALISGVRKNLLNHAGRLAKMHNIDFLGEISKPLSKQALDEVFCRTDHWSDRTRWVDAPKPSISVPQFDRGIANGDIQPFYQPKVKMDKGRIVGAESLARWIMPGGGMISPVDFVGFAEKVGKIEALTFHLFEQSLLDLKYFLRLDPDFRLAINLAPDMARDVTLPDRLNARVLEHGITPANLIFEITENSILDVDVVTLEVLSRLRVLGFELAIDDFGTGSSNIQTIRDFPYSELKIDQSFISDALIDSFSSQTVKAAVALANDQKMKIVAEGVENLETWNFLRGLNVDQVQGFLLSKAMPAEEFFRYMQMHSGGFSFSEAS